MTKLNKYIKYFIFALIPLILISFMSFKCYAYELNSEGNLVSSNLTSVSGKRITTTNDKTINVDKILIGKGNKVSLSISCTNNRTNSGNGGFGIWYGNKDFNKDNLSWSVIFNTQRISLNEGIGQQVIQIVNFTMPEDYLYIICGATWNTGIYTFNNSMVNLGDKLLPYEYYGIWYKNNPNNSVSYVLEGATCELYQNGTGNYIMNEKIHLMNNNNFTLKTDCPNISKYLSSYEGDSPYFNVKILLNLSINNNLVVECYNSIMDANFVVGNGNNYSQSFSRAPTKNTILVNPNDYYNQITYDGLYAIDYINFSINFELRDVTYSFGYNDGYDKGYSEGQQTSFEDGRLAGYQQGYNEGINSNVETNGMKTLFNSILSFPVNMVKTVFDFEFMGVNVASLVMFIVSIGIVVFVIKRFL